MTQLKTSRELFRKASHFGTLILIPISNHSRIAALLIVAAIMGLYYRELKVSSQGGSIPFFSSFVRMAERDVYVKRMDPGSLYYSVGVALVLILFPLKAAHLAIVQMAVADSAASLTGSLFPGSRRLPHSPNKSWVGFFGYWIVAFVGSLFFLEWWQAITIGLVGALIESIPVRHIDNLTIPLGVALFVITMGWG